jgi:hypothetical protein
MSGRTAETTSGKGRGGVEKAWASGRVLTAEQRARKQDADRKANRFLKKEVQDRLALLEERVLQLEATNTTTENNPPAGLNAIVAQTGTIPGASVGAPSQSNAPSNGSLTSSNDKGLQWSGMRAFAK